MRFMHIADVHLGAAPDRGFPWSQERGRELWESFRRCIADANEKKVDLLLIAGDLFHRQPQPQELREVNYLFSSLEKTVVALIAGNHDYLRPDSPYLSFPWNENVVTLFSPECERVRLPELRTEIYGFSYHRREIPEPRYDDLQAEKDDYFKILLAHGGDKVEITEEDTAYSVREKIADKIRACGAQHTYRIDLTGQHHPKFRPDIREYMKCGRILEINDHSLPAFHLEELRRQYRGQLIGDYIESFGDGPQGPVEQKALYYGLEALLYPER